MVSGFDRFRGRKSFNMVELECVEAFGHHCRSLDEESGRKVKIMKLCGTRKSCVAHKVV